VHLLDPAPRRPPEIQRVFRASPAGLLAWVLAGIGASIGFALVVRAAARSVHGLEWIVLGPLFFVFGSVLLLLVRGEPARSSRASARRTGCSASRATAST
jgi:hypothetical protein